MTPHATAVRRLLGSAALLLLACLAAPADASEPKHGLSAFGDLAYPPDFKHFNYVNPGDDPSKKK